MALTTNPNRTRGVEKRWNREINRRWNASWLAIRKLPLKQITTNLAQDDQSEVDQFNAGLEAILISFILAENWQNKYQDEVYTKAVERTSQQYLSAVPRESDDGISMAAFIAALSLALSHQNEMAFLNERANNKLTAWINALIGEVKEILNDNYAFASRAELLAAIKERLDVARSRARVIATQEITQAAQRGVIRQTEEIALATGQKVKVRWITRNDSLVRHLHAGWHGVIMTPKQASKNIQISPWNCRCGLKPVVEKHLPARINARFKKERKLLLAKRKNPVA